MSDNAVERERMERIEELARRVEESQLPAEEPGTDALTEEPPRER